jgi:protein-tyrosine phosphatase
MNVSKRGSAGRPRAPGGRQGGGRPPGPAARRAALAGAVAVILFAGLAAVGLEAGARLSANAPSPALPPAPLAERAAKGRQTNHEKPGGTVGLVTAGREDGRVAWIDLDGAVNVRDLGALPTSDGQSTAARRLLRGDNLQDLSPSDVRLLVTDIGVTTVVDLRSPTEVASEGPAPLTRVDSVRHAYLSVLPERGAATDAAADALAIRRDGARSRYPDDVRAGYYLGYLEERPDHVVAALRSIAQAPGAALVHCAAGKDRTGVVVALALSAAGVRREAVVADYLATAERMDAVLARLRASPTYADDIDSRPADEHMPQAATMAAFLGAVDSRHGGVLAWLAGHGFDADDVAALRVKLLAA